VKSQRREMFVEQLLVHNFNATKAAEAAGFSKRFANREGYRLLQDPEIQAAVAAAIEARKKRVEVDQDDVLRRLNAALNADVGNLVDANNRPLKLKDMPAEHRLAIKKVKVMELFEGRGDERQLIGYTTEFDLSDPLRAVDLAMQHLGLKKPDKLALTDAAGEGLIIEIRKPAPKPAPPSEPDVGP
jgi:phage terminase small subunit